MSMSSSPFSSPPPDAKLLAWGPRHPHRSRPHAGALTGDDDPDSLAMVLFSHLLLDLLHSRLLTHDQPSSNNSQLYK